MIILRKSFDQETSNTYVSFTELSLAEYKYTLFNKKMKEIIYDFLYFFEYNIIIYKEFYESLPKHI